MTRFTRFLFIGLVAALACLHIFLFIPSQEAREQAQLAFSDDVIETGLQYAFERRCFTAAANALELGLLCVFALTGLSRRYADWLLARTGGRRIPAALGIGLTYLVVHETLYLPLGIGRLYHAKAWGMSNLDLPDWLHDHYLAFGISLIWEVVILVGFYVLVIGFPRIWWLLAAIAGSLLGVFYAFVSPILIDPLFNEFKPLSQTEWRHHQSRVQALLDRAGVPVKEILVIDASRQSNHTNAYFTGFGSSRRIVLYDNLLKKHTGAEIESVLAHELGHWLHDHITKGILLGMCSAVVGLFLMDRLLRLAIGRAPWHLQSLADPAGLPLILLLGYLGGWVALPAGSAVSRHFERQADAVSLELAGQPDAFIACEKKMAHDNKSNVATPPWVVWLFASHPTSVERIRMAETWKAEHTNPP